jgi:DNA-binding FrmR family transcriptional regulator
LIEPDPTLQGRLNDVMKQIEAVQGSLFEVERLQRKL